MKRYFIRFECVGGNLAVEKHLYHFIKDNYADRIISKDAILSVVTAIEKERDAYLSLHLTAKPVTIHYHCAGVNDNFFISVGTMTMVLIYVRGEISKPE